MKPNEAPEKIYLFENPIDNTPDDRWLSKRYCKDDIEYIRTDSFIEKACDAYCKVCGHYPHKTPTHICRQDCDYFEEFKRYLKGGKE